MAFSKKKRKLKRDARFMNLQKHKFYKTKFLITNMEKKCRFSYNEIDDSLLLSCREENENVKENFMFDDIIFSLTGKGKIVGLQIRNMSNILSDSGISPEILNNLKEADLKIIQKENSIFIGIKFVSKNLEEKKIALGRIFMPQIAR